ncbi:MAG TPA: STAS domain-containing protein [Blastocatellia bacterium]|nr:STAS domain-containing protein [Blastocatellia bacterium]
MEIKEEKLAGKSVIHLAGNLDINAAKALEDKLVPLIESGEKNIIIDFDQLNYISSSGLRVLVFAANKLLPDKGKMDFCGMKDHIKQVFEITGFLTIFRIFPNLAEAISAK